VHSTRVVVVLVAVVAASCGSGMSFKGDTCPRVKGKFTAGLTLLEKDDGCNQALSFTTDRFEFSEKGFVSPLGDLTRCTTDQADCSVTVACTTRLIDARLDFDGELSPDSQRLSGTVTFAGSYNGCHKVVYRVSAFAEK
jgi:hypothetical protein